MRKYNTGFVLSAVAPYFIGLTLISGALYAVYNKGYTNGSNAQVVAYRETTAKRDKVLEEVKIEREKLYKAKLKTSNDKTNDYINLWRNMQRSNASLRTALNKPPEIITKYKECVYTDVDHLNTLDLYKQLD